MIGERIVRSAGRTHWRERGCQGCGVCCDLYGHTLTATSTDLDRWFNEGRTELLETVGPEGQLWWDAERGDRLDFCPFLDWLSPERGVCRIHDTKPAICNGYPTVLHAYRCVMGVRVLGTSRSPSAHE